MARFVLIDHSLKGIGGHHYDYAVSVLRAADELGLETVLGANRRFRKTADLPTGCRVFSLFRYHTYSKYTLFCGNRRRIIDAGTATKPADERTPGRSWWKRIKEHVDDLRHVGGPARRVADLLTGCQRLFQRTGIDRGDHVFIPTLSEFDLAAFAAFWRSDVRTLLPDWHLQFHYNLFEGREPDYPQQAGRLRELKAHLLRSLAAVPKHRLHFYSTTEELAAQYNRMGAARFRPLPYPVSEPFMAPAEGADSGPIRVVCAGGIRREKGLQRLQPIISEVWSDLVETGRIQFVVQSKASWLTKSPRQWIKTADAPGPPACHNRIPEGSQEPIIYIRHPLSADDYADLIRRTGIGLFLYDSKRYYVRRAGIMGEMLAVGAPVIVPSGCWLSAQIAEPIDRWRERLRAEARARGLLSTAATISELQFGGSDEPARESYEIPPGSTRLIVTFERPRRDHGLFIRIEALLETADGRTGAALAETAGVRADGAPSIAVFPLPPWAVRSELVFRNAFRRERLSIRGVSISFAAGPAAPTGAVGGIAADYRQIPRLLHELAAHYGHYRGAAAELAAGWRKDHHPRRTVAALLESAAGSPSRRAA